MLFQCSAAIAATLLLASISVAQEWTQVASMPGPGRHHPVNFVLDGKGYVATGSTSTAGNSDDFYRYDPTTDSWETLVDFPGADRSYAYGGSYNGKGYLGFGLGTAYLRDLWEYDPGTETWTELASCPGAARSHPAFVITDDGKIYVGMGNASSNFRDWWVYDIATDVWEQKALLPGAARHHPYYFNIGNTPYVAFGHGAAIFKDVYKYDLETDAWTRMNDLPGSGRVAGQQFSHNGKGYVISGDNEQHGHFPTGEFWEYDPVLDSWVELTPHPGSARWAPGTFVIGNTLYFMCGLSNVRLESDMWKYEILEPAGTDDVVLANGASWTVFPNPVRGNDLQIQGSDFELGAGAVRLLTADGREVAVLSGSPQSFRIPAQVASGRYFLSLPTNEGTETRAITVLR